MSLLAGFEHVVRENESLAPFTKLNIGGPAEYFAEPTNRDELIALVKRFSQHELPIRLLGNGTNLLVSDEGVKGLVIHLSAAEFGKIHVHDNGLTTGGGVKLNHFVSTAVREGFVGPERLVGLPGTIGGALHNNTVAHGVDIGDWVREAEVLTRSGDVVNHKAESISFSYGQSSLDELVILDVTFQFEKGDVDELTKAMQKLWIVRRASHVAMDQQSAYMFQDSGSVAAGSLIEQAGLKNLEVGKVSLFEADPNFFVCQPGASSEDVKSMMQQIQTQVAEKMEVELNTAIQVW